MSSTPKLFRKILIANRGEIALRIIRTCRAMGIQTVAVHSTADSQAAYVHLADESVCIGPPAAAASYLNVSSIVAACEITNADAVHPGYGFLAENAKFADILTHHNITFIGPSAEHIRIMGDKIEAKKTAHHILGLPIMPGSDGQINSLEEASKIAEKIQYPVLLKAASGGGGRGMRVVRDVKELAQAFTITQTEARAAFGDPTLYMEKFLENPHHIEVQILADKHGNVIHLGERDCSLQRRHQKVLEETPSPTLTAKERKFITTTCVKAIEKMGYCGAGTLEFLYENGEFYFIEMNTRIQVEHPISEMISDIDIVEEQIRTAAGFPLRAKQDAITLKGHAIECRINVEDPFNNFMPSPGVIRELHVPGGPYVRIDSGAYSGYAVSPFYDSLLGKLIVYDTTRSGCINRLRQALKEFVITGVHTTLPLFDRLLDDETFISGNYSINYLDKFLYNLKEKEKA